MQSRKQSFLEQLVRVTVNFLACSCLTMLWLPQWGVSLPFHKALVMTAPYTALSIVVGYGVRRWFTNHAK